MMVSLGKYKGLADLRRWVSNANHYIGEEKRQQRSDDRKPLKPR
jgi:hypothetical protein